MSEAGGAGGASNKDPMMVFKHIGPAKSDTSSVRSGGSSLDEFDVQSIASSSSKTSSSYSSSKLSSSTRSSLTNVSKSGKPFSVHFRQSKGDIEFTVFFLGKNWIGKVEGYTLEDLQKNGDLFRQLQRVVQASIREVESTLTEDEENLELKEWSSKKGVILEGGAAKGKPKIVKRLPSYSSQREFIEKNPDLEEMVKSTRNASIKGFSELVQHFPPKTSSLYIKPKEDDEEHQPDEADRRSRTGSLSKEEKDKRLEDWVSTSSKSGTDESDIDDLGSQISKTKTYQTEKPHPPKHLDPLGDENISQIASDFAKVADIIIKGKGNRQKADSKLENHLESFNRALGDEYSAIQDDEGPTKALQKANEMSERLSDKVREELTKKRPKDDEEAKQINALFLMHSMVGELPFPKAGLPPSYYNNNNYNNSNADDSYVSEKLQQYTQLKPTENNNSNLSSYSSDFQTLRKPQQPQSEYPIPDSMQKQIDRIAKLAKEFGKACVNNLAYPERGKINTVSNELEKAIAHQNVIQERDEQETTNYESYVRGQLMSAINRSLKTITTKTEQDKQNVNVAYEDIYPDSDAANWPYPEAGLPKHDDNDADLF